MSPRGSYRDGAGHTPANHACVPWHIAMLCFDLVSEHAIDTSYGANHKSKSSDEATSSIPPY